MTNLQVHFRRAMSPMLIVIACLISVACTPKAKVAAGDEDATAGSGSTSSQTNGNDTNDNGNGASSSTLTLSAPPVLASIHRCQPKN